MANISVPKKLKEALKQYQDNALLDFGIEFSTEQCIGLIKENVQGLHFYTLNKSYSTDKILNNIKE